jgi:hypothetical protein
MGQCYRDKALKISSFFCSVPIVDTLVNVIYDMFHNMERSIQGDWMTKYFQKSWTATSEALQQLASIATHLGESNMSNTIRYCIRQEYKRLEATTQKTKRVCHER